MDPRKAKIKQAQRLRDLGFYNNASVLYEQLATPELENCSIFLEWAAMKVEQGLIGQCRDKLDALEKLLQHESADQTYKAIFEMLYATVTIIGEVAFSEPMKKLERVFHEELEGRTVEEYDKRAVTIVVLYHLMCRLRTVYGYMPENPILTVEHSILGELCRYLIKERRYAEALRVSRILYNREDRLNAVNKSQMLREILNCPDVPELVRAETLLEYAEDLQQVSFDNEWIRFMEKADEVYRSAGHAYGSLLIKLHLLEKRKLTVDDHQAAVEMLRIKKSMEEVGYWTGGLDALRTYSQFQLDRLGRLEEDMLVEIDSELLRYRSICKNNFDWISQTNLNFTRWQLSGANIGKGLHVLEQIYDEMADIEAPFLLADTLGKLHEAYIKIGDEERAAACLTRRPEVLPRKMVVLLGVDPFYKSLKEGTDTPDLESSLASLQNEIRIAMEMIQMTTSLQERGNEVMRLSHISNLYLMALNRRGIENTRRLVQPCLEAVHGACQHLDNSQANLWTSNALQTEARLLFMEAYLNEDKTMKVSLMQESLQIHERTFTRFKSLRRKFDMAMAKQNIALCYDSTWQFNAMPSQSNDFSRAAANYADAKELLASSGQLATQQMVIRTGIQFWFRGLQNNVDVKTWFGLSSVSPMETLMKYIEESERLSTIERNDMAALDPERAILAKQALRKDPAVQSVYDIAIKAFARIDDYENVWKWVQKSKARSVSDMLALGVNLPADLVAEIDADPELRPLLDQEWSLLQKIEGAEASQKVYLRKQVDALRKKMRKHPTLGKILDLREGEPITLSALRSLGNRMVAGRRILFVDWLTINDHVCCLIASNEGVRGYLVGMSTEDCNRWKEKYLRPKVTEVVEDGDESAEGKVCNTGKAKEVEDKNHRNTKARVIVEYPLAEDDMDPLREISKLIQPVIGESKDADLFVFCPSGVVHGIPLHAATVAEDSDTSLIERNPVVYTSSMTTFEHCMSRQKQRRHGTASFVAVFEETVHGPLDDRGRVFRDRVYASVRGMAAKATTSTILIGEDASPTAVSKAFGADFVYFYGHCSVDEENMLRQGLLLHPQMDASGKLESPKFTASDMFSTPIQPSNVVLMACASASESHAPGDEPLGITTALLCAGASSVTGTMWAVDVRTALAFTDKFHSTFSEELLREPSSVDLAVVVQETICRMKKRKDSKTPFHWASFLLHGSWLVEK